MAESSKTFNAHTRARAHTHVRSRSPLLKPLRRLTHTEIHYVPYDLRCSDKAGQPTINTHPHKTGGGSVATEHALSVPVCLPAYLPPPPPPPPPLSLSLSLSLFSLSLFPLSLVSMECSGREQGWFPFVCSKVRRQTDKSMCEDRFTIPRRCQSSLHSFCLRYPTPDNLPVA